LGIAVPHPYGAIGDARLVGYVERERALAALAGNQYGVIARDQIVGLGFSARSIDNRLNSHRLSRVHEGVYAVGSAPLSQAGRHTAALLAIRPDPLLCHVSSAARQQLMREGREIHVAISTRVTRSLSGVVVHRPRRIDPEDRTRIDGFPMTSVPRTLLDLGQILSFSRLQKVVEEADRIEVLDIHAIEEVICRYPGHRGCRPLRRIISDYLSTPRANVGVERNFQLLLAEYGLPLPEANALVEGQIVDCWGPSRRFVVELDSRGWHKTWQAHERDRKRDAVLLRAGISSLRITHRRIQRERAEVARDVSAGLGLIDRPTPRGPD
jgi:hypothetical protein